MGSTDESRTLGGAGGRVSYESLTDFISGRRSYILRHADRAVLSILSSIVRAYAADPKCPEKERKERRRKEVVVISSYEPRELLPDVPWNLSSFA